MESISLFRGIGKQLILCNFDSDVELRLCASTWTVCFSWVSVDRSARFQGGLEGGYRGAPRASGIGAGRGLIIVVERSDRRRLRSAAAAAGAKVLCFCPVPLDSLLGNKCFHSHGNHLFPGLGIRRSENGLELDSTRELIPIPTGMELLIPCAHSSNAGRGRGTYFRSMIPNREITGSTVESELIILPTCGSSSSSSSRRDTMRTSPCRAR
jgi:hypothetical protein